MHSTLSFSCLFCTSYLTPQFFPSLYIHASRLAGSAPNKCTVHYHFSCFFKQKNFLIPNNVEIEENQGLQGRWWFITHVTAHHRVVSALRTVRVKVLQQQLPPALRTVFHVLPYIINLPLICCRWLLRHGTV